MEESPMKKNMFSLIGAGVGLVLFVALALLPAMLYGGYAGVLLASGIFGTPLEPTLLVRMFIIGGMILGTVAMASLFAVGGAAIGGAIGALTIVPDPGQILERK
jgi:hypothetical protein